MASKCAHVILWVAACVLGFHSEACRAQAAGNIMVVERHVGGSTVYCLRNGGQSDAVVMVSFTNLSGGLRMNSQVMVAAQTFSRDVTTSDSSTKPVIMSVQFTPVQSSDPSQPAPTP